MRESLVPGSRNPIPLCVGVYSRGELQKDSRVPLTGRSSLGTGTEAPSTASFATPPTPGAARNFARMTVQMGSSSTMKLVRFLQT